MSDDIKKKVSEMLNKHNIGYKVVIYKVGVNRGGWTCDAFKVYFMKGDRQESFDYFAGVGHRKKELECKGIKNKELAELKRVRNKNNAFNYVKEFVVEPHPADVLYCLISDYQLVDGNSFYSFCDHLGYDTDSRKALNTYLKCQEDGEKLVGLMGYNLVKSLETLFEDY